MLDQQSEEPPGNGDSRLSPGLSMPVLTSTVRMLAQALRLDGCPDNAIIALLRHAVAEPFIDPAVMRTRLRLPPDGRGGPRWPCIALGRLLGLALRQGGVDLSNPAASRFRWRASGVVDRAVDAAPVSSISVNPDAQRWLLYKDVRFVITWPEEEGQALLASAQENPDRVPVGIRIFVVTATEATQHDADLGRDDVETSVQADDLLRSYPIGRAFLQQVEIAPPGAG
jgi:hypothetical protein